VKKQLLFQGQRMNNSKKKIKWTPGKVIQRLKKFIILPAFLRDMKRLEIGGLSFGNDVMLITDGDRCFDSFLNDISLAKKSINLETFIFKSDDVGWKVAEALAVRAKYGVEVNVIYDAVGSIGTSSKLFAFMKKSGIEVIQYNPIAPWRKFFNLTLRDHRKILTIDGKIAYVGGINISSEYAGKKYKGGHWRDTHIRITGPAVKDIQFFFIENWFRQGGTIMRNDYHFPKLTRTDDKLMMILSTRSRKNIRPIFESYYSAIVTAKKSIHITNAYFIPNRKIHHELVKAAERGVDVRFILPGLSDVQIVKHASRYLYRYYLRHGIRVYEYQKSILHAKTAVIDGVWSTIGSSNLDRQSLFTNLEVNAVILDDFFGKEMEDVFKKDLRQCVEVTPKSLSRRSIGQFLLQWLSYRFRNIL
jgi:cardiolipin synthase A/B